MKLKTKLTRKLKKIEKYYNDNRGALWFAFFSGLLAGVIVTQSLLRPSRTSPEPQGLIEVQQIETDEHSLEYYQSDPIRYIRYRGEQLGIDNEVITTAIRIAKAEAKCNTKHVKTCIPDNGVSGIGLDPYAKNPNSSATGIFQFLWSTWDNYKCEGERWDFVDNTNCFYKLYTEQTARYAKKGLVYNFSDWNESRSSWSK